MKYVWELNEWPIFTFNEDEVLQRASCDQSAVRLDKEIDSLPGSDRENAMLDVMVQEAVNTSSIEGVYVSRKDVRDSIRRRLAKDPAPIKRGQNRAEGVAELMVSVREHFDEPLTKERLWEWQRMIIAEGEKDSSGYEIERGRWRTCIMHVVDMSGGIDEISYVAPPPARVPEDMDRFIDWFNNSRGINGIVRAGLAHVYFESIHPFGDGNGRVGRAIADKALAQDAGGPIPYGLSSVIEENKQGYYGAMQNAQQHDMDATLWMLWFADHVRMAREKAIDRAREVILKTRLWDKHSPNLNDRQSKFIAHMFREDTRGFDRNRAQEEYVMIAGGDEKTAASDLLGLLNMRVIEMVEGPEGAARYEINLRKSERDEME